MKIVILGKGFIGTHLSHYFTRNNVEHIALSQKELNYTDHETLHEFIRNGNSAIKCVINCSGFTGVPNVDGCETEKELCYSYNVSKPLDVVKICNIYNIPVIHVGSGCIYTGYTKEFTETDIPNFGLFNTESSFYSKCKHIFETLIENHGCYVLRIRIPFIPQQHRKNYLTKLLNYNNLINEKNSITSVSDFCAFVARLVNRPDVPYGIYNVVNSGAVTALEVIDILKKYNYNNPNWKIIPTDTLQTKALRSNCVLSTNMIQQLGLELPDARQSLIRDISLRQL